MAARGDLGGSENGGAGPNVAEEEEGAAARSSFSLDSTAAERRAREVEARRLPPAPGAAMAEVDGTVEVE